jgi:hypothetical protein
MFHILVGQPEEKKLFGRLGHRWEDTTEMYLKEIQWRESVDWIHLAQEIDRW